MPLPRSLPPFLPLVAFDAVARHSSFTRAADELGVTQSAISHQIRRLEEHFELQLFRRLNPDIVLTEDGRALHAQLVPILESMAAMGHSRRQDSDRTILRVGAGSALATWWLVRRLPAFHALHPSVQIDFEPIESDAAPARPLDVRIHWTHVAQARATSTQRPLLQEHIFPVCAPQLIPSGEPPRLTGMTLIQKGRDPVSEWSWPFWFSELGLGDAPSDGLVLKDIGLCLTAAVEGTGVALGRSLLVADAIEDGRLVPVRGTPAILSSKLHVISWARDRIGDRAVEAFASWVEREVRGSATRLANLLEQGCAGAAS